MNCSKFDMRDQVKFHRTRGHSMVERFARRLQDFVDVNGLDEECGETLFSLSPDTAAAIMDNAFVLKGVDPNKGSASGLVMALVRRFGTSKEGGKGSGKGDVRAARYQGAPPPWKQFAWIEKNPYN